MAAPSISQLDMCNFHTKHFSSISTDYFSTHFLGPKEGAETYAEAEEEDDGLGYYEDGVKRTLTDEQIAMFRHSEIETLLREKRKAEEVRAEKALDSAQEVAAESEDQRPTAEVSESPISLPEDQKLHKNNVQIQKKKKSQFKRNVKPDLRKRTWDKVDSGLETLDYEEDVPGLTSKRTAGPQRRKVSYDDM